MPREVEAKALYQCPLCGKSHTVKVKAKVKPRLTLHRDMTETEAYELEDLEITAAREREANRSD